MFCEEEKNNNIERVKTQKQLTKEYLEKFSKDIKRVSSTGKESDKDRDKISNFVFVCK